LATSEQAAGGAPSTGARLSLPTETEIYLLPDGRVVVADLPAELSELAAALGSVASGACDLRDAGSPAALESAERVLDSGKGAQP
jgi:hypothetical protein